MVVRKQLSKHLNVGAYNNHNVERYEHEIKRESGHVIRACRHGSI